MSVLEHSEGTGKAVAGWVGDAILGTSAVGAWLLEIEKVMGAVGAAIIFALALATAIYRFMYWRSKAKREQAAFEREK